MKSFTMPQIQSMIDEGKAILVLENDVLDVTNFLNRHPGGKFVIKSKLGIVDEKHYNMHSERAKKMWLNYKIGTLSSSACCQIT